MKSWIKSLWLSTFLSFLLSLQYIERYADEKNRMLFFWNRWDALAIIFSSFIVGLVFWVFYMVSNRINRTWSRRTVETAFIFVLGIAVIKDVENWLLKSPFNDRFEALFKYLITGAWLILTALIGFYLISGNKKIKNGAIKFCLISSPIIAIFAINLTVASAWTSVRGKLFDNAEKIRVASVNIPNAYIFVFDEWSYERSFKNKELLPIFKNLNEFKKSSVTFHEAYSPYDHTFRSLPAFIFQNEGEFLLLKGKLYFKDKESKFKPIEEVGSIFDPPHKEGFKTILLGFYFPYSDFLSRRIDYVFSSSSYKIFGGNFLEVSLYHLLKTFVLYFNHFQSHGTKLIESTAENYFQARRIERLHLQTLSVIQNIDHPTFAFFHYPIPHDPLIYGQNGPKNLFHVYQKNDISNYLGNLAYLDRLIGEIVTILKESGKFDNSLIVITSDHSWRPDPNVPSASSDPRRRHVPLFVKYPHQKKMAEITDPTETVRLFHFLENSH